MNRSELYKKYKSEQPLKNRTAEINNEILDESDLIPIMELLYVIYLDEVNINPDERDD